MLQPHSFLWHYLWVAPNLLLAVLAVLLWLRGLYREFHGFVVYAWFQVVQWAVLYPVDLIPSISAENYWRVLWLSLLIESLILFVLISEIFAEVLGSYPALAKFGKYLIRVAGALLVVVATVVAAYAPIDNTFWLIPASHILQEAVNVVSCGLIFLLFLSAAYFRLTWKHGVFGIALGLGISACVHLATWAVMANGGLADKRHLLDMVNMATNHACVLIWFYYLLVPQKIATNSAVPLPEHNLEVWNRELERLLQQ
jgi:hypothetical protein